MDTLEKYGQELVEKARNQKLDPVIGRDSEIRNIIRILSRKTKNNPVLIGEPGVGKTAVVEGNFPVRISEHSQKQMLHGYIFIPQLLRLVLGSDQDLIQTVLYYI